MVAVTVAERPLEHRLPNPRTAEGALDVRGRLKIFLRDSSAASYNNSRTEWTSHRKEVEISYK